MVMKVLVACEFSGIVRDAFKMLNDPNLDWKDTGLLTYLISKPETWEVSDI